MHDLSLRTPSRNSWDGFLVPRAARAFRASALVLAFAMLAACSSGGGAAIATASRDAPSAATPTATATRVSFPLDVTDQTGARVRIATRPERIVSLSPAITETLFALGLGNSIVGATDADDYPAEAKALPDVASFQGVVVEKVVAARPDVVFGAADLGQGPAIARLRSLGLTVITVQPVTLDDVLGALLLVGKASGVASEAESMVAQMRERMDRITRAAQATGTTPRVFYELGAEPDLYGLTDGSYTADLVRRAGGVPITTGSSTDARMPLERLVSSDPEVIVLGDANYGTTPESVRARGAVWRSMTAVRTGAIRPIDDIIVTRPGPRLAAGLEALARAIHPELSLPPAQPSPVGSAAPSG